MYYVFNTVRRASKNTSAWFRVKVKAGLNLTAAGPQPPAWIPVM